MRNMGKRTIVNITKDIDGRYKWSGKNAECCIMAIHVNGYVTDDRLGSFIKDKVITENECLSIYSFDDGKGTDDDFKIIQKLAERLKLKIRVNERSKTEKLK